MTFEAIKCPHCGVAGNSEIISDDSELKWNYNYNCYSKKVYCSCGNCYGMFSMKELYDIVGYDEDSVKLEI